MIEAASEAPSGGGAVSTGLPGIAAALASLAPLHREVVLLRNVFRLSAGNVERVLDIEADEVHRLELTALELMSERVAAQSGARDREAGVPQDRDPLAV